MSANESATRRMAALFILLVCAVVAAPGSVAQSSPEQPRTQSQAAMAPAQPTLVIEGDSQLPDTFPRASYEYQFHARGGVPPLRWTVEKKGDVPPGLRLEPTGLLHGQPERAGEFQFTVSVKDASGQGVQKAFVLRVRSALTINWKTPAHVSGNRIEGSVDVSNTTPDDMDLTYVVMAVAGNGRATAIGYQHFVLTHGTMEMELPFGETLPSGGYVVHVDVVGEVAKRNLIYRERMQTPSPLHVTIGP